MPSTRESAQTTEGDATAYLREQLEREEAELAKLEEPIEAKRDIVRRLRASLAALQTGTFGSKSVTDQEIVDFLESHTVENKPMLAAEIAQGMGLDTRGLSRRLPRMVKDRLLAGDPEKGYLVSDEYQNVASLSSAPSAKRRSSQ